jgi:amino acid transporter
MAFLSAIVAIAWSFLTALTVAVIIRVLVYLFVCGSLIMLRKKMQQQTNFFKIRGGNIIAVTGIILCIWLLSAAKIIELRNVAIFLALGTIVYFFQMRKYKKDKM